jgi:hypothetical protein
VNADEDLQEPGKLVYSPDNATAVIASVNESQTVQVELYDSSITRHISPYCSDFMAYQQLDPPQYLHAANKQQFPAKGTGSMSVCMPNGLITSELTLDNVLHAPSVTYTLVSISMLDTHGYCTIIEGSYMDIFSLEHKCITHISWSVHGLYRVLHNGKAMAVKVMTVMELYRQMGHIVPASMCKLVESRQVTEITLDLELQEEYCLSCVYACSLHQPVPKVCISKQVQSFSDEIHTDV